MKTEMHAEKTPSRRFAWIRTPSPRTRILIGFIVGVLTFGVFLFAAELVFYALNHPPPVQPTLDPMDFFVTGHDLGAVPRPHADVQAIKRFQGEVIYNVNYRIDAFSRRITPQPSVKADKFLMYFGGSFVFGEGVEQDETIPAHVATLRPSARAYNYGFSGYGTQQMLAILESQDFENQITEPSGTLVYTFIDGHVRRAIGSFRMWITWGQHYPYYRMDGNSSVVRDGTFSTGRPWSSRFYDVLKREQILRYFNVDLPIQVRHKDIDLTVAIIARAREIFLERYPDGRFVTMLYPRAEPFQVDLDYLRSALKTADIEVLDLTRLLDLKDPAYFIRGDGHPNANAHAKVAAELSRCLDN